MSDKVKIDISTAAILRIIAIILMLLFLYSIRTILVELFIVAILVASFRPVVNKWSKKIGKALSILALTLLFFAFIAGFFYLIVPPVIEQVKQFANNYPSYIENYKILSSKVPEISKYTSSISQNIGNYSSSFVGLTTSFFGGLAGFFTIIILTIYFLIDEEIFKSFAEQLIPERKKHQIIQLCNKLYDKIGNWFRGEILLGLIIGLFSYIGLSIIGLPYALVLAVVAGVCELIPVVGPIISGVIAALVALTVSPVTALIVVVFAIILQQLEGNLIVPKVMQKAVGLPPAIIIIAIMIGSHLLGILGALLAVPLSGVLYVIFQEWKTIRQLMSNS